MRVQTFIKEFNSADLISLYRILSSPLLIKTILSGKRKIAGAFLSVNFLTDAVDGIVARSKNMVTQKGATLDSVGDVLTFCAGVIALVKYEPKFFKKKQNILAAGLALYVFQMIAGLAKYGKVTSFHTYGAKISAILQAVFLSKLVFSKPDKKLFNIMMAAGIFETIEETALVFKLDEYQTDIKSIAEVYLKK